MLLSREIRNLTPTVDFSLPQILCSYPHPMANLGRGWDRQTLLLRCLHRARLSNWGYVSTEGCIDVLFFPFDVSNGAVALKAWPSAVPQRTSAVTCAP